MTYNFFPFKKKKGKVRKGQFKMHLSVWYIHRLSEHQVQEKQAVFTFTLFAVKQLNVYWANITLNSLQTVSTQQWRALSLTSNVQVQMNSKIQSMKFAVASGISRGRRISNILDLLISHVNSFTKPFCQTVWSWCICLCHDDDNIKWGWVGKVLWGSILSMQCSLLSKSYELELNYFLSVSVRGPGIQCLVMTRPNCKPLKESLPLCFRT